MTGLGHYFCTSATPTLFTAAAKEKTLYPEKKKKSHPNYSDEGVTQCLKFRKDFPPTAAVCIFANAKAIPK
jgi:hypothetical protein